MPENLRSGLRARDASPDSVIFTLESNFSLFSSASASVDRCSFASDAHDDDSLASEMSQLHLAVHEESSSGPDLLPPPNKQTTVYNDNRSHSHSHSNSTHTRLSRKPAPTHTKALQHNNCAGVISAVRDDSDQLLDFDLARSSFSLALKECQDRRSRSEATKKVDRRRPASLDLNHVAAVSSPRFEKVKKSSLLSRKSGTFPSPGTPNYRHSSVSMHKGWSSERVPLHSTANRRHVGNAAMLPLTNGRTLPSKWEDAERWICSPVSGDGVMRSSLQQKNQYRKPKSKSGPLGPPGVAYYSLYSPAVPVFDGGNIGNFIAGSPFSAGVIAPDGLAFRSSNAGLGLGFPARNEPCMARSVSVHGCSETLGHTASLPSQEEKIEGVKDAATDISRAVSRRDMATQMSPEGSNNSSSSRRVSFSASTPPALPMVEMQGMNLSRVDVRDVQVDERVTVTRWTKKHRSRNHGKTSDIVDDWRKKSSDVQSFSWDISEAAKGISKAKREEAKITAWENLQKAKAEAAIRKLEMKLEKKRSSSMDKIMNKLRSAQKKAQEMRSSVLANQSHQVSGTSHKAISFRRTRQMGSLSGCFTCHAF